MIQDIHPHKLNVDFIETEVCENDYIVSFSGDQVLLNQEGIFPVAKDFAVEDAQYLFTCNHRRFFLGKEQQEDGKHHYENVQCFRRMQPQWMAFAGTTAWQLSHFYDRNQYCGKCGSAMAPSKKERSMVCTQCGLTKYPKIAPAVIVGIVDGDRILLTKYSSEHSSYAKYALVAGYTEIGETLEETVRREVKEEVGLFVKDIVYYNNQPWGLSDSLLVGFFARVEGDTTITLDKKELSVAEWVTRDQMEVSESTISLTRTMMEAFRLNEKIWK